MESNAVALQKSVQIRVLLSKTTHLYVDPGVKTAVTRRMDLEINSRVKSTSSPPEDRTILIGNLLMFTVGLSPCGSQMSKTGLLTLNPLVSTNGILNSRRPPKGILMSLFNGPASLL